MSERGFAVLVLLLLLSATVSAEDSYPSDITPPPGTRYPCALTALPRRLSGIRAWSRMQARYPGWSSETRDSIYHHLCALDLF